MILNLTQHPATPEQKAAGVLDLTGSALALLKQALTFDTLPTPGDVEEAAQVIAGIAALNAAPDDREGGGGGLALYALIGGAPFLMAPLERALQDQGITPLYAFSRRESVEEVLADGSVRKTAVFRHAGFIEPA